MSASAQVFQASSGMSSSWGRSGYVSDYYHGERTVFEQDENMFDYGNSFVQDFQSTSTVRTNAQSVYGMLYTAADNITPGSTTADYAEDYTRRVMRRVPGVPGGDIHIPIGDGWDVMLLLCLMAVAYGIRTYVRTRMRADNK